MPNSWAPAGGRGGSPGRLLGSIDGGRRRAAMRRGRGGSRREWWGFDGGDRRRIRGEEGCGTTLWDWESAARNIYRLGTWPFDSGLVTLPNLVHQRLASSPSLALCWWYIAQQQAPRPPSPHRSPCCLPGGPIAAVSGARCLRPCFSLPFSPCPTASRRMRRSQSPSMKTALRP